MRLKDTIRIGTRKSRLALAQAALVSEALQRAHGFAGDAILIHAMTTTGDRLSGPLVEEGGKGLFTKEIEDALLSGEIDIAVHSAKDMAAEIPRGLILSACLPREDARDCLVGTPLCDLQRGATLGTSSPRRAALIKRLRPDLNIVGFRGNVDTRIKKIAQGEAHATVLALAGLKRLGMESAAAETLNLRSFPPAVGQGAIVIEVREDDARMHSLLAAINHVPTFTALSTERAYLAALEGSCRTPIAGHAIVSGMIKFHGMILRPDGKEAHEIIVEGKPADAEKLGRNAGLELKARAPRDFFEAA